jgi:hypothetical protein
MLPIFRRFSRQDAPMAPEWIDGVFGPLNVFCETTVQTLNKNLAVGTNVQGQKYTTSFTTDSSGLLSTSITFKYTGGGQPDCCIVGRIVAADGSPVTTSVVVSNWSLNINTAVPTVVVGYISGLVANTKYTITLLVI